MSTADESIKQAVKSGAIVVGLGRAAGPAADALHEALGAHARECADDDWEASRVNHLCLVVECGPTGACCEAAEKFMREVRRSDGYSVYSEIIRRRVAVLALGRPGAVAGAGKVEEALLKRGGCTRLLPPPSIGTVESASGVAALPWTRKAVEALAALAPQPHEPEPVE
mmetsp:Transcript_23689/g.75823  ORF Transcript_23689/g.75823 Transcript_23689/m.75823 type:complete len:169 (-) Transcript_23689:130-636(-)